MPISIRIKRGVGGAPTTLLRGELAFDESNQKLYIGKGDSSVDDANGLPIATSVVELTTPPTVLADLADISVGSGASDGDVLVYDSENDEWVAQAITASSVAWDDVTSKPASFTPSTHASSHHTGGGDAIAPADIGAAAATHSHAWGDITSGVPASFTPSAHKTSHATGGADALSPADIGAAAASHTHAASDITSGLATVATTGAYSDLSGTPTLGTAAASATGDFAAASHTHGSISSDGTIGSTAGLVVQTGASGALSTLTAGTSGQVLKQGASGLEWGTAGGVGTVTSIAAGTGLTGGTITSSGTIAVTYGSTASTACEGNDSRLSDTRTPTDNTVSTAKLQDAAVTYAKIQDVSATDRILGRSTAGSGDVEEITCTAAGRALLDDADAAAQRTTLGLGSAATSATSAFAAATHSHAWADITSGVPASFTPSAHSHTVTLEISGFIESPEAKTYVLSPAIPAAITIVNVKAKTSAGTVDIKLQDDGVDISNTTIGDVGTSVAEPSEEPSATVASGSVLALVVSDPQSSPADLAFTVHYTVTSANNA